ncbi:MAG: hypothetical protein Q8O39_00125 [bacterium]|nr:hypothetical protein [bacterium]
MTKISTEMMNDELIELMKKPEFADEAFAMFNANGEEMLVCNGGTKRGFKIRELCEIIKNCPFKRIEALELFVEGKLDQQLTLAPLKKHGLFAHIPCHKEEARRVWGLILGKIFDPEEREPKKIIKELKELKNLNYPAFYKKAKEIFFDTFEANFDLVLNRHGRDMEILSPDRTDELLLKIMEGLYDFHDLDIEFFDMVMRVRKGDREIDLIKTILKFKKHFPSFGSRCKYEISEANPEIEIFIKIMEDEPEIQDLCFVEVLLKNPTVKNLMEVLSIEPSKTKAPYFSHFVSLFQEPSGKEIKNILFPAQ